MAESIFGFGIIILFCLVYWLASRQMRRRERLLAELRTVLLNEARAGRVDAGRSQRFARNDTPARDF
jgi:hypothetical protein